MKQVAVLPTPLPRIHSKFAGAHLMISWVKTGTVRVKCFALTLELPDQISNSPYRQPYNSYNVSSENLVLDQLMIPKVIFFFILITYLVDIVLML